MLKKRLDTGKNKTQQRRRLKVVGCAAKSLAKIVPRKSIAQMHHQDVVGHNLNIVTVRNLK